MFKQKLAMIEFKELGWDDMQKLYEKFQNLAKTLPETGKKSNNLASQGDELSTLSSAEQQNRRQQAWHYYRYMFNYMIDIIDIISEQIFDKTSTVPYAIRQFCKCLYQACKNKFGEKPTVAVYQ